MKYEGRFRTLKDEMIQVVIITNNDVSQEKEIFFADESPVMISQSSDGIFSPIKSRSCTIKLVTKDELFDIYSGSSHGTSVAVNNLTNSECLFYGYVTPCQYNQPYLYNNEIEIEAVDAISTLQDFKYSYLNGKESSVAIMDIIKKLMEIAGYSGKIYMQYNGNKLKVLQIPTQFEYINDDIFFEDDGEASDCYAVLEEICNFYGISCVPYGNDVFFVDYQVIAYVEDDNLLYTDLKSLVNSTFYITDSITKEDYAGDDQNLEMDEVYNKINIKADVAEVKDDDLGVNPEDDAKSSTYYDTRIDAGERSDGKKWAIASRYFEYIQGTYANDNSDNWQTPINCNIIADSVGYKLAGRFDKTYIHLSHQLGWLFLMAMVQVHLILLQVSVVYLLSSLDMNLLKKCLIVPNGIICYLSSLRAIGFINIIKKIMQELYQKIYSTNGKLLFMSNVLEDINQC